MLVISIFIFCIVLFLYLHIHFHLKRSNDLEVYEIEQPSKQRLEEVCDIRQPTTFEFYNDQLLTQVSYQSIHTNYRAFDIHIRDVAKPQPYPQAPKTIALCPCLIAVSKRSLNRSCIHHFLANLYFLTQMQLHHI